MAKKKDSLAIFSDKPTSKDLLNFRDYSKLLSDVIVHSETPSTIGIFGEWGSGKTSLMLMIEELLGRKNIRIIWFNAWKYDKEDALWRALILSILRGLNTGKKTIDDTTLKLYEAVSTEKLGRLQIDWLEIGKSLLKGAAFIVAPLFLIPGVANAFANASFLDQVASAFTRRKIEQSRDRISSIEQFEELYKTLINTHLAKGERLVILIDDLDRCEPARSLEVLEALKSFLDAEGCIYVVACDTRLINQGLHSKYGGGNDINLDDYLGKIIQFSFVIPPIRTEDAERFIKNLGLVDQSDEFARLISSTIELNPRKLKRFLTDLKIKGQLVKQRNLFLTNDALVKMSCVAYAWKEFWTASLRDNSVFSRAQRIANSTNEGEETPDDIEFEKLFHIDSRLKEFLNHQPLVTDADLHEYIFLATATIVSTSNRRKKEGLQFEALGKGSLEFALGDVKVNQNQKDVIGKIVEAINNASPLIVLSGKPGVGKTTVLKFLAGIESSNFVSVYVQIPSFVRPYSGPARLVTVYWGDLIRQLAQLLNQKGYSFHSTPDEVFNPELVMAFEEFLESKTTWLKNKRLVIILDEYDAVTGNLSSFDDDFSKYVQSLIEKNKNITVILGCRDMSQPVLAKKASISISLSERDVIDFIREYDRLISLPIYSFDIGDYYELLFLLENELRKLIAMQFTKFHWWEKGLSRGFYKKASSRLSEKPRRQDELLDLFAIGELFEIILDSDNWQTIFETIFIDKNDLTTKSNLIVRARNSIAHSRALSSVEMQEFIYMAKELLQKIHPRIFVA